MGLAACQPQHPPIDTAAAPPVGHYQGSIGATGSPQLKASLDIRHPSAGHYDAELTVPGAPALSFVADTLLLAGNQLRLVRPARPGQTLTLTLEGDFWRGTLAVDSTSVPLILLKRGVPDPSSYRVGLLPVAGAPSWLFAPTDIGTPGAALVLLPDAATTPAAALWADALARAGVIVLLLPPPADSATAEVPRLLAALRQLRATPGADTASLGVWAAGNRATTLAAAHPPLAFFIVQNALVDAASRPAFRELRNRKLPVLGLYGGADAVPRAAQLRAAVGSRQGNLVRSYRATSADLLSGAGLNVQFGPGLPGEVVEWVRSR
ncbi:hypothetical protein MON38_11365 [Hymenobacter sp. DH14]|uniref:Uncharacterized protein n=1 Tax=Hymenobacter cyanobacteriorum TaxID=2926463 RepID=A0A9X2AHW8_9BACT|nr:hypothetical protein [Hymenobacter cyanobacteriorum]MCI1188020.1 hypothetical protein [Hymenobacter cyanobacteriorum]